MEDLLAEITNELLPSQARETYQTLGKILGNILENPGEAKFRSLKKDNKVISGKVLRSKHAVSLLLAMGFEDDGAAYVCPPEADLEIVRTARDLILCLALSTEDVRDSSSRNSAAPELTGAAESAPELVGTAASCDAAPALAASTASSLAALAAQNPQGFKRHKEVEVKRQDQIDQLQVARAARGAHYAENPQGPAVFVDPAPAAPEVAGGYSAAATGATAKKKQQPGASDFQNRGRKEQEKKQAAMSMEEIRKQQKEKYKDFQSDPNAQKQAAYQQPPSVAAGTKVDEGWGGWFGGMFGGGSSSNGSKPKPQQERRGPNIKGVGDLPKPVQRG